MLDDDTRMPPSHETFKAGREREETWTWTLWLWTLDLDLLVNSRNGGCGSRTKDFKE